MDIHVTDLADASRTIDYDDATWRLITALVGLTGAVDDEQLERATSASATFTADETQRIAAALEEMVSGQLGSMYSSFTLRHRELLTFIDFLKSSEGIQVSR